MNHRLKRFIGSTTTRLGLTYLSIIILMGIGFSMVFYNISSEQIGRQLPPEPFYSDAFNKGPGDNGVLRNPPPHEEVEIFFRGRIEEGRHALLIHLILLNFFALAAGSVVSYFLARRTLRPIEEAMEAQSQFVSDASHELRTPLTVLQATNEVALRKSKLTPAETKVLIENNITETKKLRELSDSLLKLLKTDSRYPPTDAVSLQEVAADAMNAVVQCPSKKHIIVQDEVANITVTGDKTMLTQVLKILLDNAIKYSPDKTNIYLSTTVKSKSKYVYLRVRDEGIGIEASDIPHLFKRFYRADRSRSKVQADGYGLGLSIACKLVKHHGGAITVESTPDQGSTFIVKLPLER